MDPLSALSVAAAIVQFVDFGSRLLWAGYGAYKSANGSTEDDARLTMVHKDLKAMAERLARASPANPAFKQSDDEIALQDLAKECEKLATRLLAILSKLEVKGQGLPRAWDAVRASIRKVAKADEIASLQVALVNVRSELSLRLLCLLRDGQSSLQKSVEQIRQDARAHQTANATALNDTRQELLISIQALDDELKQNAGLASIIQSTSHWAVQRIEARLDLLSRRLEALHKSACDTDKVNKILSSLLFAEYKARYTQITDAHFKTFEWIFDEATIPFRSWLETNSQGGDANVFWVTGKAGSGKSTLMKFVAEHCQTKDSLDQWASERKLTTASFYFWNPGSEIQRSQLGLLQSLLFQILRAVPHVMQVALPGRWSSDNFSLNHPYEAPWTAEELFNALRRALNASAEDHCFCFFVDGLDEFEPSKSRDHYGLVAELLTLAASPAVKLCVSSRPWPVFSRQLGSSMIWSVTMEDLTKKDMEKYIYDVLVHDDRFTTRLREDPQLRELVIDIRRNADGVFLWVFLVTRSLLDGLTNEDDIAQLRERLAVLPNDLQRYFQDILDKVDGTYHADSARLLLLAAIQNALHSVDVYNIAVDRRDPDRLVRMANAALHSQGRFVQLQTGMRYIDTWCKDLLKLTPLGNVRFTHRTVFDFVVSDAHSALLVRAGKDNGHRFEPLLTECKLALAALKSRELTCEKLAARGIQGVNREILRILRAAERCQSEDFEPSTIVCLVNVLDELDRVASEKWSALSKCGQSERAQDIAGVYFDGLSQLREVLSQHWTIMAGWSRPRPGHHRPAVASSLCPCESEVFCSLTQFVVFAAFLGLSHYVFVKLSRFTHQELLAFTASLQESNRNERRHIAQSGGPQFSKVGCTNGRLRIAEYLLGRGFVTSLDALSGYLEKGAIPRSDTLVAGGAYSRRREDGPSSVVTEKAHSHWRQHDLNQPEPKALIIKALRRNAFSEHR